MSTYEPYQPKNWNNGEIVYENDLDHIENGIKNLEDYFTNVFSIDFDNLNTTVSNHTSRLNTLDTNITNLNSNINNLPNKSSVINVGDMPSFTGVGTRNNPTNISNAIIEALQKSAFIYIPSGYYYCNVRIDPTNIAGEGALGASCTIYCNDGTWLMPYDKTRIFSVYGCRFTLYGGHFVSGLNPNDEVKDYCYFPLNESGQVTVHMPVNYSGNSVENGSRVERANTSLIRLEQCANCRIERIISDYSNYSSVIGITGSQNVVIENIQCVNFLTEAILILDGAEKQNRNIVIRNCTFAYSRYRRELGYTYFIGTGVTDFADSFYLIKQGKSPIMPVENLLIENNYCYDSEDSGIDTHGAYNVIIRNNTVRQTVCAITAYNDNRRALRPEDWHMQNVLIENNYCVSNKQRNNTQGKLDHPFVLIQGSYYDGSMYVPSAYTIMKLKTDGNLPAPEDQTGTPPMPYPAVLPEITTTKPDYTGNIPPSSLGTDRGISYSTYINNLPHNGNEAIATNINGNLYYVKLVQSNRGQVDYMKMMGNSMISIDSSTGNLIIPDIDPDIKNQLGYGAQQNYNRFKSQAGSNNYTYATGCSSYDDYSNIIIQNNYFQSPNLIGIISVEGLVKNILITNNIFKPIGEIYSIKLNFALQFKIINNSSASGGAEGQIRIGFGTGEIKNNHNMIWIKASGGNQGSVWADYDLDKNILQDNTLVNSSVINTLKKNTISKYNNTLYLCINPFITQIQSSSNSSTTKYISYDSVAKNFKRHNQNQSNALIPHYFIPGLAVLNTTTNTTYYVKDIVDVCRFTLMDSSGNPFTPSSDFNNQEFKNKVVSIDDIAINLDSSNLKTGLNLVKSNKFLTFDPDVQNTNAKKWQYLWDNLFKYITLGSTTHVIFDSNISGFISNGKITGNPLPILVSRVTCSGSSTNMSIRIHGTTGEGVYQYCWKITRTLNNNTPEYSVGRVFKYSGEEL